jgi:hypothetical protein
MSGTYYWVTVPYTAIENGKPVMRMRQERRVRWWPSSGERADHYDDLLECGSRHVPAAIAARLDTFRTDALLPYQADYLAGFAAERHTIPFGEAWNNARERLLASQARRCAGDVPGDTHRDLDVTTRLHDETFKHVLLPVWVLSYTYAKRTFNVLVNGQTGEVEGEAPLSVLKVAALVGAILAVAGVVFLVAAGT